MAIQINNLVINTQDFSLGGRKMRATYTPSIDEQFSDLMIDLDDLQAKLSSKATDNLQVDEKKKLLNDATTEIIDKSTAYIKALFTEADADYLIEHSGGRATNLARLAGTFFSAGNEQAEKANRSERRNKE